VLAKLLPGLVAPLLFLAAGVGWQACLRHPIERSRIARLGLSYLLGVAWSSLGFWALAFGLRMPLTRGWLSMVAAVPVVAGLVAITRRRGDLGGWRRAPAGVPPARAIDRWARRGTVLVFASISVALLADCVASPVADFDGRMTWGTLARYIAADHDVLPSAVVDPEAFVVHPRYPLVLPLAQVAAVEWSGAGFDSFAIRPLYTLFLPALLLTVWPALVRAGRPAGASVAALLLWAAPCLLTAPEIGPRGTYSDLPLAAFVAGAGVLLFHPRARTERGRAWLAGLLLAAAVGTKNEGLLLAPAVLGALAFAGPRAARLGRRRAGLLVISAAALVLTWRLAIPNRNDEGYFETFSPSAVMSGLAERATTIGADVARISLRWAEWGPTFWLLPFLLLAAGAVVWRTRVARLAGPWIAAQVGLVVVAYSVVPDLVNVEVTWSRFLLQMSMPLAWLAAVATRAVVTGGGAFSGRPEVPSQPEAGPAS